VNLDDRLVNLENRKRALEMELEKAASELLDHIRASRDGRGRMIAGFAETAEPVSDKIEKFEGEIKLIRDDLAAIRDALGNYKSVNELWLEIKRLQSRLETARRNVIRAREIAAREGVEPDQIMKHKRVAEAQSVLDRVEADSALENLRARFKSIKSILNKYD